MLYDKGLKLIEGKCRARVFCATCAATLRTRHRRDGGSAEGAGVVPLACAESYGDGCGALAFWLDKHGGSGAEVTATYEKACELEVARACSRAASRISNADPSAAKPLQLAERGCRLDTKECGMLAELHRLGRGTQRDQDKATEIYRAASHISPSSAVCKIDEAVLCLGGPFGVGFFPLQIVQRQGLR